METNMNLRLSIEARSGSEAADSLCYGESGGKVLQKIKIRRPKANLASNPWRCIRF
jgi:hypothetical protein